MILSTARLLLREQNQDDLPFMAELLADPQVMRFWPAALSVAQAAEWIATQQARYTRDGYGYWLALDRATGEPIGQAGVLACEVDGVVEPSLGYMFMPPTWGQGLAREAAHGCLRWARETKSISRVTCLVRPENVRSLRVALRTGFLPEKHVAYKGFAHLYLAQHLG